MKCENCGATLQLDKENRMQFCPYCGYAIQKPESYFDYKKFVLNHKEEAKKQRFKEKLKDERHGFKGLLILIGIPLILIIIAALSVTSSHKNNVNYLQKLSIEIESDIVNNRLDEAYVKTLQLRLDDGYSDEASERWNKQREDYQKLIEEKKKERP